jgi:colanic acid biosynthesis glycosyl transferase WcaI
MKVQLWSYNYAPEPTGIAPVSAVLAKGLRLLGHEVSVVAAHPHYPSPQWGNAIRPYREERDGIPVLRLPLWIGRANGAERMRQELTFVASQFAALPALGRPDLVVSASPSFPALLPAGIYTQLGRTPWVLWLHDILPDGAVATGIVNGGMTLRAARWLERSAYRRSDRIVVLSAPFVDNLRAKGVPADKIDLIYDPATRRFPQQIVAADRFRRPRILSMGNIGKTQGLAPLASAFDRSPEIARLGAKLIIAGDGVAAPEVREAIEDRQVEMLGVVSDERLEEELRSAALGVITQQFEGTEFNLPSKLMNFMAYGLPIVAAVNPDSEVARLVREADAGWVVDSSDPVAFPRATADALERPHEAIRRGAAGRRFAEQHFRGDAFSRRFETLLRDVAASRNGGHVSLGNGLPSNGQGSSSNGHGAKDGQGSSNGGRNRIGAAPAAEALSPRRHQSRGSKDA